LPSHLSPNSLRPMNHRSEKDDIVHNILEWIGEI